MTKWQTKQKGWERLARHEAIRWLSRMECLERCESMFDGEVNFQWLHIDDETTNWNEMLCLLAALVMVAMTADAFCAVLTIFFSANTAAYDNRIINVSQIIWRVCRWFKWSSSCFIFFSVPQPMIECEEEVKRELRGVKRSLRGRHWRLKCLHAHNFHPKTEAQKRATSKWEVERRKTWNLI